MEKEKNFLSKIKSFKDFNMPRWDDLPEIDLYMDQVISVTDKLLSSLSVEDTPILTPSMINNYVKKQNNSSPCKEKIQQRAPCKVNNNLHNEADNGNLRDSGHNDSERSPLRNGTNAR